MEGFAKITTTILTQNKFNKKKNIEENKKERKKTMKKY